MIGRGGQLAAQQRLSGDHYVDASQDGIENELAFQQIGRGVGERLEVSQVGDFNFARVLQAGEGSVMNITQAGVSNNAIVTQGN